MRNDSYTKGVTVIAVFLWVLALRPYFSPDAVAYAQGSFVGVQFSGSAPWSFFDPRTGEIYSYDYKSDLVKHRLTKLGAPLLQEK